LGIEARPYDTELSDPAQRREFAARRPFTDAAAPRTGSVKTRTRVRKNRVNFGEIEHSENDIDISDR
jgi:hypothetical protein